MFHRKPVPFVSALGLLLVLLQVHAYGWGNTWMGANLEQIINAMRWKAGPFKYSTALRLDNAGYDSDIYYGANQNPAPDSTFMAGVDLRFFLPLKKKIVFDVAEFPQYAFFFKNERERALNNTFTGQVHFVFDRFYIQAGMGLINVRDRLSTELNIKVRHREDSLSGLVFWQASKETSFALQYRRFKYNYEDMIVGGSNIRENLNRLESYLGITAYLQQHQKMRFYLNGEYGFIKFFAPVTRSRDTKSYSVYGGVDFLPPEAGYDGQTAGIRGRIDLGYTRFNISNPQMKDYSGLVGSTEVSIGIMRLTALRAFFFRGPQYSVYSDYSSYVRTTYGIGLARSLARKILFTYDLYHGSNDYVGGEGAGGDSLENVIDLYTTHSFRLNLRLRRDLRISLLTSLGKRSSSLAFRSVSERYFLGFSLVYGYLSGELSMLVSPISP